MGRRLATALAPLTFAVIDFEFTTPTGAPPAPIEVAVQTLRVIDGNLRRVWSFEALICPPRHAAVTGFDTNQTGITAAMLAGQPPAADVLADLDARFDDDTTTILVAHNAPSEARILYDHREHCPRMARTELLDTVRLGRDRYPGLPRHNLDTLATHLGLQVPIDRHRAMSDVQLTTDVLIALLHHETRWPDLRTLRAVAGYPARAADEDRAQEALF